MKTSFTHVIKQREEISKRDLFLVSMASSYDIRKIKTPFLDFIEFCNKEYEKYEKKKAKA